MAGEPNADDTWRLLRLALEKYVRKGVYGILWGRTGKKAKSRQGAVQERLEGEILKQLPVGCTSGL